MCNNFTKNRLNPIEVIKSFWPNADNSHIEYDPNMKHGDYSIIRQSSGDGLLLYTLEMFEDALFPLVKQQSFYKPKEPDDWNNVTGIKYKIGPMKHSTVFGMIHLECDNNKMYSGQKERVRIPVVCQILTK